VPRLASLTPHDVHAGETHGDAVVDLRSVHEYAGGHIPGVFHVELRPAFAYDVRERLGSGEPLIVLDVRQAHEWSAAHIPRAEVVEARALPTAELELPRDRLIATHRGHGQRAATGLSVLEQRGYRNLALITEGVDEWRTAGGQLETACP
jgi:rhodanese-related sulfurtransferase